MKIFLFVPLCIISFSALSQSFRLNGYANYVTTDDVDATYSTGRSYNGKIGGGFQWGAGAEFVIGSSVGIELGYNSQKISTVMKIPVLYGITTKGYEVNLGWLMLKANKYFGKKENKFQGFAGAGLGLCMTKTNPDDKGNSGSDNSLAWDLHGGGIFWPSQAIGIKLNAQFQMAPTGTGSAFILPFNSIGNEVSSSSALSQFGVGLGVILVMDKIAEK
jgi:opacity protein-like surface antigen